MRNLIINVSMLAIVGGCCPKKASAPATPVNYGPGIITQVIAHDTIPIGRKDDPEMYQVMYEYVRDSMKHSYDSITDANEILGRKLLVAQFKLKQIEKYNNITINNKSQMKYLNGWIKRALKD